MMKNSIIEKIKRATSDFFSDLSLIYKIYLDRKAPKIANIFAVITICYCLSPIDLIPDFIPILGYLDDIIIVPILISITLNLIPQNLIEQYRFNSLGIWKYQSIEKWYYVIPMIIFWVVFILIFVI